jgi:nucleoside 2-deoxyribosyltransferase
MSVERQRITRSLDEMFDFLETHPPDKKLEEGDFRTTRRILSRAMDYALQYEPSPQRDHLMMLYDRFKKTDPSNFEQIKELSLGFRSAFMSFLAWDRDRESEYVERKLTRRISELEGELVQLRTNPALEKKVAKLEEEVRRVRLASEVGENEGKEQEDILKKYKSADKKVFVIMPFATRFDDVWRGGIARACQSENMVCLRVDQISLSTWITEDIEKCIETADVVISDITGSSPNVMFELGWALAKGKKPIVIRQQDDPNQVPFDVHNIRYIPYINSWSGIESLFKQICKFIKSTSDALSEETSKKTQKKESKN